MDFSPDQDLRIALPPVLEAEPSKSWLRVEIHFSAVLLFYCTIYGLLGTWYVISSYYFGPHHLADATLGQKALTALPFIIGGPVVAGFDWLRLMLLAWFTRKLGSMA